MRPLGEQARLLLLPRAVASAAASAAFACAVSIAASCRRKWASAIASLSTAAPMPSTAACCRRCAPEELELVGDAALLLIDARLARPSSRSAARASSWRRASARLEEEGGRLAAVARLGQHRHVRLDAVVLGGRRAPEVDGWKR